MKKTITLSKPTNYAELIGLMQTVFAHDHTAIANEVIETPFYSYFIEVGETQLATKVKLLALSTLASIDNGILQPAFTSDRHIKIQNPINNYIENLNYLLTEYIYQYLHAAGAINKGNRDAIEAIRAGGEIGAFHWCKSR